MRLPASLGVEPALSGPVLAWAEGATLTQVLEDSELTAGDFVRWVKQLLDLLGQVASLRPDPQEPSLLASVSRLSVAAAEAVQDVSRGVVSWSSV